MTKFTKTKILAKRRVQKAESREQKAERQLSYARLETRNASLEKQLALLEEQIALLKGGEESDELRAASREKEESPHATARAGIPLPPPVIESVRQIDSRTLQASWAATEDAAGYVVRVSSDSTFANDLRTVEVSAPATTTMLGGLRAETTYYIKAKALAQAGGTDSDFSSATSATTGLAADDNATTSFQYWLADQQTLLQNFAAIVPQLGNTVLTTDQRRRLQGSGVRRYGFIDKVSDVAEEYSQFWPSSVYGTGVPVDFQDKLKERLREIEALRNVMIWTRHVNRVVGDLLLIAGDDAFRMANTYYASVRAAARSNIPEAPHVFRLLQLFWNKRPRVLEEPTNNEVERDVHGLLSGKKEGKVSITRESPTVTGGKLNVVDETQTCKRKQTCKNKGKRAESGEP